MLLVAVGVLTITCIGLSVAVASANAGDSAKNGETSELVQTTTAPTTSSKADKKDGQPWEVDPRLPKHLIPLHYDLWLHPDLESGLFKGKKFAKIPYFCSLSLSIRAST